MDQVLFLLQIGTLFLLFFPSSSHIGTATESFVPFSNRTNSFLLPSSNRDWVPAFSSSYSSCFVLPHFLLLLLFLFPLLLVPFYCWNSGLSPFLFFLLKQGTNSPLSSSYKETVCPNNCTTLLGDSVYTLSRFCAGKLIICYWMCLISWTLYFLWLYICVCFFVPHFIQACTLLSTSCLGSKRP